MASSSKKITKFNNSRTLVTSDFMNSIFGGLSGTTEGDSLPSDDPRVVGHIHDGENLDGHAGKIDLVNHVTGQLRNTNLGDQSVTARTVARFEDPSQAIPVSEVIGGTTFYYIDVSTLPTGTGAFATSSNVTSNSPGALATDDFVFGSDSLDDDGNADHYNRVIYDKSKGAFRAGVADSTQWDNASRGIASTAFGKDNTAAGNFSTIAGGNTNGISSSADNSFVAGGSGNTISGAQNGLIGVGSSNSINNCPGSTVLNGSSNVIGPNVSSAAAILGGTGNTIASSDVAGKSVIVGGNSNAIANVGSSEQSFIGAGDSNEITGGDDNGIVSGGSNSISATGGGGQDFIGAGFDNTISGGFKSGIVSGESNTIGTGCNLSFIGSGSSNLIDDSAIANFIGAGGYSFGAAGNRIEASSGGSPGSCNAIVAGHLNLIDINGLGSNFIGSGSGNEMTGASTNYNFIGSGVSNSINGASIAFIGGGRENSIENDDGGVICGGGGNSTGNSITSNVTTDPTCFIGGGKLNTIVADDPECSVILGGYNNQVTVGHGTVLGGRNNEIIENAQYAVAIGQEASAKSYGEFAHSSAAIVGAVKGSAQKSTFIFSDDLNGGSSDTAILWLDGNNGGNESVFMPNDSTHYVTFHLVVKDKLNAGFSGLKQSMLISCDGVGAVTLEGTSSATDVIDPGGESWSLLLATSTNSWNIRAVRGAGVPPFDKVCVCTAEVTQVIA